MSSKEMIIIIGRPRKNPKAEVGKTYQDSYIVEELPYVEGTGAPRKYKLRCIKCGREKIMQEQCITGPNPRGLSHKACGKGIKLKDKKFHNTWCGLRSRTNNPKYDHYNCYGGRGINSDAFENFIDFYDTMYESYLEAQKKYPGENLSIDRINVNGHYSPENCRWIPMTLQKSNMRTNRWFVGLSPNGDLYISKNQRDFAFKHNLSDRQVNACLFGRFQTTRKWKFRFLTEEECNDYSEIAEKITATEVGASELETMGETPLTRTTLSFDKKE